MFFSPKSIIFTGFYFFFCASDQGLNFMGLCQDIKIQLASSIYVCNIFIIFSMFPLEW